MIDFAAIADEIGLIGKERVEQIAQMERNPKFTAEEVAKRRRRVPVMRDAYRVLKALAECPEAQRIILARVGE
jgi:hypothetical protein